MMGELEVKGSILVCLNVRVGRSSAALHLHGTLDRLKTRPGGHYTVYMEI